MLKSRCAICQGLFDIIEEHHIIPQASGGVDGPTATLCGAHHSLIHDTADRVVREYRKGKRGINLDQFAWTGPDKPHWKRGSYYVREIVKATLQPNSSAVIHRISLTLTDDQLELVKKLKHVTGLSSQQKVMYAALKMLAQHYGIK